MNHQIDPAVLEALVENSQDQLVYLDRDFNFVFVNRAYAETCRRAPEEFIGHNHFDFYPHPENQVIFERVRDTGEPAVWREKSFIFPDQPERGTTCWDWTLTPIKDNRGWVDGLVFSLREVTEKVIARQKIMESEERFRVLIEASSQAVWETDVNGVVVTDSPSWRAYTGQTLEEWLGYGWVNAVHPEDREYAEQQWREAVRIGMTVNAESRLRSPDGGWRWTNVRAAPIRNPGGSVAKWVGMNLDITERKQAEERLRISEARMRAVFGALIEGVVFLNPQGEVMEANDAVQHLHGHSLDELTRAELDPRSRIVHSDGTPFLVDEQPAMVALRTGSAVSDVEMGVPLRDGSMRWRLVNAQPVRDDQGHLLGAVASFFDITERKRAEEALRDSRMKLKVALASIKEAIFIADVDGRFSDFNDEFVRYHRFKDRDECSKAIADCPKYLDASFEDGTPAPLDMWAMPRALRGETGSDVEYKLRRKDTGETWWGSYCFAPIRDQDGRIVGAIVAGREITERKRAEDALQVANRQLTEADRRKNEFLGMLSHELRNPLAPICNSLYILERAIPGGEQAKRAHTVIGRQVTHLTRLVDDLLDVTRITRGKIQLQKERLDLGDIVWRTVEDHRNIFSAHGVGLAVENFGEPLWIQADATRIIQVVGNLLSNAVKFTRPGNQVRLSLEREDCAAILRVKDNGVGIEAGVLNRLFQPFMQAAQTLDRSQGGLGLGLALVKGLVELHGGSVSAASEGAGRGAEFTVRLPIEETEQQPAPSSAECRVRQHRILIIEDSVDAAGALKEVLEMIGHEVQVAYDGSTGIALAREHRPDLVLCDIGLPGMDGYQVARLLRADSHSCQATLVSLSGYAKPDDIARAREAGFDEHLAKPPSIEELERVLSCVAA